MSLLEKWMSYCSTRVLLHPSITLHLHQLPSRRERQWNTAVTLRRNASTYPKEHTLHLPRRRMRSNMRLLLPFGVCLSPPLGLVS